MGGTYLYQFIEFQYIIVNLMLVGYGLHYWYLTWQYWIEKAREDHEIQMQRMKGGGGSSGHGAGGEDPRDSKPSTAVLRDANHKLIAGPSFVWPSVTLQLPIFNEGAVAKRLIVSCLNMDYPVDKLEIQILDDSTDNTPVIVQNTLRTLAPHRFPIRHIRRDNREGYKAGALQAGLQVSNGEYIAIFDADFEPQPQYLRDILPHFFDPDHVKSHYYANGMGRKGICCVQARWGFTNREYSLLTKLQAVAIDGHFVIEQTSRCEGGFLLNFNGTGGVWRRAAINDVGGWTHDTLAEDLDLSYRAQFGGWQIKYVPDIIAPSEVPPSIAAFKKQQQRWAKGTMQCLRKHLRNCWTQPGLTFRQRVECTFHLSGYLINLLMAVSLVLTFPVFIWWQSDLTPYIREISPVMMLVAVGPTMLYLSAQVAQDDPNPMRMVYLPVLVLLGYGLCFSNSYAVIEGLFKSGGKFERTQKFGLTDLNDADESFFITGAAIQEGVIENATEDDVAVLTQPAVEADEDVAGPDTSKVFPRIELISLIAMLLGWALKLFLNPEIHFEGGDVWVCIYAISAALMIFFGLQDVRALNQAHEQELKKRRNHNRNRNSQAV